MAGFIAMRGLELRGAYGRETNMQDWRDGKDFKITGGPYCSNRDVEAMRDEGFDMLEFVQDGKLIERVMLNEKLISLVETCTGEFERVE